MLALISGETYKDVNGHDFNHYFANTLMAWRISPTKRRAYLCNGIDENGDVAGQYLTREREFKDKKFVWKEWYKSLETVVLQTLMFNVPGGCAVWKHQLAKNQKKSFPWTFGAVKFFGDVPMAERSVQNMTFYAFSELYHASRPAPLLAQALREKRSAVVTSDKFLVDYRGGVLYFKHEVVGELKGDLIQIPETKRFLRDVLIRKFSVSPDLIKIVPTPEAYDVILSQATNKDFVEGYAPHQYKVGYAAIFTRQDHPHTGKIRTYKGRPPTQQGLMEYWEIYNSWENKP